jgi:subtilase family serine protease
LDEMYCNGTVAPLIFYSQKMNTMKYVIFFTVTLSLCLNAKSQIDSTKRKIITKETPKTLTIDNQRYIKGQKGATSTPPVLMPDLTIVSFDAHYLGTQLVDGVTKNLVQITYTIKNEGNASVPANMVGWQGWITYDSGNPKLIPGGGAAVSASATDVINPGDTRQRSFRVTVPFDKSNHPLYTMYLDDLNTVKESNEQNNVMQKAISF